MINRSITLSCYEDDTTEYYLDLLQNYCHIMKIGLNVMGMNGRLYLKFTGNDQNLMELEDYLSERVG